MSCKLIAHRGLPVQRPENSLDGFAAALAAGAGFVETDVQLSADGVPLLCHDDSLMRMTGHDLPVGATSAAAIRALPAGQPRRFGTRYADNRIATLEEFAGLLGRWPDARAFVEIKSAALRTFGNGRVLDAVGAALAPVLARCTLISFDHAVLVAARSRGLGPVGWVLPGWDPATRQLADALAPDCLFVGRRQLPATATLWPGPWRWAVYTVNRAAELARYRARGFDLIETDDIARLIAVDDHPGGP